MFEFLFNYSPAVFAKGKFVLLGSWPVWLLVALVLAVAAGIGWNIWRQRSSMASGMRGWRPVLVWALQAALLTLILTLLWEPALQISTLKPQQNIVAVIVDDSRSMAIVEDGEARSARATEVLRDGLLDELGEAFQIRLYRMGAQLERIKSLDQVTATNQATQIGESLKQVVVEAGSLPIGAALLLSDGADNSGGIDLETIGEIRSRRIPVHTIGFGREQFARDIEITDVQTPARTLADSRLMARVTLKQTGYTGETVRLTLREGGRVLASKSVTFTDSRGQQTEALLFNAGAAGAKHLTVSLEPQANEENPNNNQVSRLVNVDGNKPRVLYLEGEPRWEYKFIRRALAGDRNVQLISMLRTTQNKIYRQGIEHAEELQEGFPGAVEELFDYQGLIIGNVEAAYLTSGQQELIRQFVDRRGGGLLFLGGRSALADGGYGASVLADLLPVKLPSGKNTFHRDRALVRLSAAGRDSLLTRLEEDPEKNIRTWEDLPQLADYQIVGAPKPGALVLAELESPIGNTHPLLATENYGHGRTAVFATGGSWRWQMQRPLEDQSHEVFWQQLLRWLVTGSPGRVTASTPKQMLADESRMQVNAIVRDKTYAPTMDARVEARILGPGGSADTIELTPDPVERGRYTAEWRAEQPGSFMAEVIARRGNDEVGRDVLTFRREDGVAENFRAEQNRELLEKLSSETGGSYYSPEDLSSLAKEISYSEAGITLRETKDLWNMPAIFLLIILLKTAEWFVRRRWGVV